ncbi:hypothetical protein [Ancylobacter rudongensis]|uniref:Uncharacterized protein n=1 Tax=Ancylobacter rudongensis TaxID=177413 RepID=A0A1G4URR7_9HYPH|nr:hypothetical protein [Ancylobacter rudongensis]SCW95519.1 hypothetical protein SAMN05660859_0046 [Ancylobacter rudongensis]
MPRTPHASKRTAYGDGMRSSLATTTSERRHLDRWRRQTSLATPSRLPSDDCLEDGLAGPELDDVYRLVGLGATCAIPAE